MTLVKNVQTRWGLWLPDSPGSGYLRQSFEVDTAGRATRLIEDMARQLEASVDWCEYGRTCVPWGYPYGVHVDKIPVGGVLIRAGLETSVEYSYMEGPDSSRVAVDVLMNQGTDWSFIEQLYGRMVQIEEAVEAMRAIVIPPAVAAVADEEEARDAAGA